MEKVAVIQLLITQIIIILLFLFIIILLLDIKRKNKIQKKFSKYSVQSIKHTEIPFFENFVVIFKNLIILNSKWLKKMKIFDKYAATYEKHIDFEDMGNIEGMNYVSLKFVLGFVMMFLYFLTLVFQYKTINFFVTILIFLIGFFVLDIFIQLKYIKRKKLIEADLLKAIIIMNNAFKSGRSTMQAIEIVKEELDGPISDEFKKIYMDISYGLSLEIVFDRFYKRVKLEEAKYITSSLTLLNKTGGNIVKVFSSIEKEFFSKKKLDNELKMMTSSSIFVFRLLLFVPFILTVIIWVLNNNFFDPLFNTKIGIVILIFVSLLYILYILIVKKILKAGI